MSATLDNDASKAADAPMLRDACYSSTDEVRAALVAFARAAAEDPQAAAFYWAGIGITPEPVGKGGKRIHWCGVFVLWLLRQLKLCDWPWRTGRGFVYRLKRIPVTDAKPGDVIVRKRAWHHAMLLERKPDGTLITADGNSGAAPGEVRITDGKRVDDPDQWAYCIEALCEQLVAKDPA
jgi:hypothetical protein